MFPRPATSIPDLDFKIALNHAGRTDSKSDVFKKIFTPTVETSVSPAVFNDPLALRTEWIPLKSGGSNFKTNHLHRITSTRWEFRSSTAMKCFSGLFFIIGVAICVCSVSKHTPRTGDSWNSEFFFLTGFGAIFALVGGMLGYSSLVPAVFDKDRGYFSRSRKKPEHLADPSKLKNYVELKRIHALQLLKEHCKGDKSSYYSYELNLVLDDTSRMNVIDHGNLEAVREDARGLAEFLGKPLWDSI